MLFNVAECGGSFQQLLSDDEFDESSTSPPKSKKAKILKCTECDFDSHKSDVMRTHVEKVHLKMRHYSCPECDHTTFDNSTLQYHIATVHKKLKRFQCSFCDYKTFGAFALRRHENSVHKKIKPFQCPYCQQSFSRKEHVKKHCNSMHSDENPLFPIVVDDENSDESCNFRCPYCHKGFLEKEDLRVHYDTEHKENGLVNSVKENSSSSSDGDSNTCSTGLQENLKKKHDCSFCGRAFSRQKNLQNHINAVHNERNLPAADCVKTSETNNVQSFTCPYCHKSFAQKDQFRIHYENEHKNTSSFSKTDDISLLDSEKSSFEPKNMINGQSEFSCDKCPSTFAYEEILKIHYNAVHNNSSDEPRSPMNEIETPDELFFKCQYCALSFSRKEHLRNHCIQNHNEDDAFGTRPDSASLCDEEPSPQFFSNKSFFNNHTEECSPDEDLELADSDKETLDSNKILNTLSQFTKLFSRKSELESDFAAVHPKPNSIKDILDYGKNTVSNEEQTSFTCSYCPDIFKHKLHLQLHYVIAHNTQQPLGTEFDIIPSSRDINPVRRDSTNESNSPSSFIRKLCSESMGKNESSKGYSLSKGVDVLSSSGIFSQDVDMDGKLTYPCPYCTRSFTRKKNLENHCFSVHNEKYNSDLNEGNISFSSLFQPETKLAYPCKYCQRSFSRRKNLQNHCLNVHNEIYPVDMDVVCPTNEFNFNNVRPDSDSNYKCPYCTRSFSRKKNMQNHCVLVHKETAPLDSLSNLDSANLSLVYSDILSKNDPTLFKCPYCPNSFATENELSIHYEIEHEDPFGSTNENKLSTFTKNNSIAEKAESLPFPCSHCSESFSQQLHLQLHCAVKHNQLNLFPSSSESFSISNVGSSNGDDFKEESRKVSGHSLRFVCRHCQEDFDEKVSLENHYLQVHKEIFLLDDDIIGSLDKSLPFTCPYCHRSFIERDILRSHYATFHKTLNANKSKVLIGDDIKDKIKVINVEVFECPYCEESFESKEDLTIHDNAMHNNQAIYSKCDDFSSKDNNNPRHSVSGKIIFTRLSNLCRIFD